MGDVTMADLTDIVLPDLGKDSGDEATVSFWQVDEDEPVEKGDDLVEMSTDKASFFVPSPVAGVLREILEDEGAQVTVGDVLCRIEPADD